MSARSEEAEQIRGIENGADDYITKPFSIGVLAAKINAILRNKSRTQNDNLSFAGLCLSADTMTLSHNNLSIELTKNEYKILRILMSNVDKIVTREQILEELWDDRSFIDDNTLTVNIARVRKRLGDIGLSDAISTKRGVGYTFSQEPMGGSIKNQQELASLWLSIFAKSWDMRWMWTPWQDKVRVYPLPLLQKCKLSVSLINCVD